MGAGSLQGSVGVNGSDNKAATQRSECTPMHVLHDFVGNNFSGFIECATVVIPLGLCLTNQQRPLHMQRIVDFIALPLYNKLL